MAPSGVLADAQSYASVKRQIKVAVLTTSALNVVVPSGTSPENPDPHVFYVADKRADLKPIGMEFVNPLAPPVITASIYQRWLKRVRTGGVISDPAFIPGTAASQLFQVGSRVTKNRGAYWEMNLDQMTQDNLKQYDLLFLHSHRNKAVFSAAQREKLRKFVEAGGTLWVENCGQFSIDNNAPFLYDINIHSGSNGAAGAVIALPNHPLVSYPYLMTPQEVQSLGDKFVNDYYLFQADPTNVADIGPGPDGINPPATGVLQPIIWNTRGLAPANVVTPNTGWRPYVMAGPIGAGRLVMSSGDSGCAINDYVGGNNAGYGGNSAAISGDAINAAHPTDLKFLYNLSLWSSTHESPAGNNHRTGYTIERSGAALVEKWAGTPGNGNFQVGGPVFSKHCVFSVDGNLILHCYDIKPSEDLDGDGNSDDGLVDFVAGTSKDEIWNVDLKSVPGGASATGAATPVLTEFYDANYPNLSTGSFINFPNREQVVVALNNGVILAFRAFPRLATPGFPLASQTVLEWNVTNLSTSLPARQYANLLPGLTPSVVYSEGVVYASFNTADGGRIAAIDPHDGTSYYHPGIAVQAGTNGGLVPDVPGVPAFVSTPTLGVVRDIGTGTMDKILYAHTAAFIQGGQAAFPESIRAFPIGSKNEPLRRVGTSNVFLSRSTGTSVQPWYIYDPSTPNKNRDLRPRVYATYTDPATGSYYTMELAYDQTGTAQNSFKVDQSSNQQARVTVVSPIKYPNSGPSVNANDDNLLVTGDYYLNWFMTDPTMPKVNSRSIIAIADPARAGNLIGGGPSLSESDILYLTVDASVTNGTNRSAGIIEAIQEQGSAGNIMKWSFLMHDGFTFTTDDQSSHTIGPRLRQLDAGTKKILAGTNIGDYITNVEFVGTPAIRNGVVYATAIGVLGGQKVSVVCAFSGNPEIILQFAPNMNPQTLQIAQYSPAFSGNDKISRTVMQRSQYTYDPISGLIRITSMHAVTAGGTGGSFVTGSLPFAIKANGASEVLVYGTQTDIIDPNNTVENRVIGPAGVDNLLWYAVIPSGAVPPFNSSGGGNVGLVTTSPSIQNDILWLGTSTGYILSMDADPGASDPSAQVQGAQIKLVEADGSTLNHLRWSYHGGFTTSPIMSAPVATMNVLAVNSAEGVRAYEDTYTMIADGNRLIEVNSAGEAVWTCDGSRTYGTAGGDLPQFITDPGTGLIIPVNPSNATGVPVMQNIRWAQPTVARRIGVSDLLVVDTGNNRVLEVDRGGNTIFEVNRMFDDFKGLIRPGDPLTLNAPTDANTWTEAVPNINQWFASQGLSYTYGNLSGFVVHYLIADTGNFRIVELVDVYDQAGRVVTPLVGGNPAGFTLRRQLLFSSSTYAIDGKRYRFKSLQRITQNNLALKNAGSPYYDPTRPLIRQWTLSLVDNYRVPANPAILGAAINNVGPPTEAGGGSIVMLDESGKPIFTVSDMRIPTGANSYAVQPIVNPTFLSEVDDLDAMGNIVFKFLLTDANGCYQLKLTFDNSTPPGKSFLDCEWILSSSDYRAMTGKPFTPTCIRRLNTVVQTGANKGLHRYLITNRATGPDNPSVFGVTYNTTANGDLGNISGPGDFAGEVFEINPFSFNWTQPIHGYVPDYTVFQNFLLPNDGAQHPLFTGLQPALPSLASIVWRSSTEQAPLPPDYRDPLKPVFGQIGTLKRSIGSKNRATFTSTLREPSFADRQY